MSKPVVPRESSSAISNEVIRLRSKVAELEGDNVDLVEQVARVQDGYVKLDSDHRDVIALYNGSLAKVAEQAEYMRLAAIECKSLMEFRDEALRTNAEQAATIERLTKAAIFIAFGKQHTGVISCPQDYSFYIEPFRKAAQQALVGLDINDEQIDAALNS